MENPVHVDVRTYRTPAHCVSISQNVLVGITFSWLHAGVFIYNVREHILHAHAYVIHVELFREWRMFFHCRPSVWRPGVPGPSVSRPGICPGLACPGLACQGLACQGVVCRGVESVVILNIDRSLRATHALSTPNLCVQQRRYCCILLSIYRVLLDAVVSPAQCYLIMIRSD